MATLGSMVERISDNLMIAGVPSPVHGEIARRCETAHQRISQELRVPTRYIKGVDATQPFLMPNEARPDGMVYAEIENDNDSPNHIIPLLTVQEANDIGVKWDTVDPNLEKYRGSAHLGRYLIIYDPANVSAPMYPLGFKAGDTLRMLYVIKPSPMMEFGDEPFEGQMPSYAGDMIVQYVSFEILFAAGLEQSQAFYNDYRRLAEEAFAYTRPALWRPRPSQKEIFR